MPVAKLAEILKVDQAFQVVDLSELGRGLQAELGDHAA
jgi:hypothetical protein